MRQQRHEMHGRAVHKIPRPCSFPGCLAVTPSGYCAAHRAGLDRRYNVQRSDDPIRKLYNTQRWYWTRQNVLFRYPTCAECKTQASTVADHVIDARLWVARGGDFFDESNLTGLCKECHDRRTAKEHLAGKHWNTPL